MNEFEKKILLLEKALKRERIARQSSENLLEDKSRQLYQTNQNLESQFQHLQHTQMQLIQSEKMSGLGQMAAGVAHEINNPVGFIMSNLSTLSEYAEIFTTLFKKYQALLMKVKSLHHAEFTTLIHEIETLETKEDLNFISEDIVNLVKESLDGVDRVQGIVKSLKSFSRLDESTLKKADINEGIESTLKIVWNELKYKCTIIKNLRPLPQINCYPSQLNQVFMNLLTNAAQAIERQGTITIDSSHDNENIILKFSDTGQGIKSDNLSKLFNPFFTTKPVGKGTGLGLSVSYGIVKKHGGSIEVESEIGKGTCFVIKIPLKGVSNETTHSAVC